MQHFLGQDGFIWFIGVVEDRLDPQYMGRVRIRCLGIHTDNKEDLPTADLPWAMPLLPITSSGISGIGQTPTGLVEGSWVFGFFRDASYMQEPIVVGSLPGRPSTEAADGGFNDPNKIFPRHIDEPDNNRLSVNLKDDDGNEINPHLALTLRRETRITGLATADFDQTTAADASVIAASDTDNWDQPAIAYNALYPNNQVYESETGHLLEFDDTLDHERIHLYHKTGSSIEYNPNGDRVQIVKGADYMLTSGAHKVDIQGQSDITIGGRHKLYINKDGAEDNNYDIQVGPNANINVQVDKGSINLVTKDGKINVNSAGDYNVKVGGNYTMTVAGNRTITTEGSTTDNTTGAVTHRGKTIDLNP